MPQKHLFKTGKKAKKPDSTKGKLKPPSRHGKKALTKKGKLVKPPKGKMAKDKWKENLETTRVINAFNEKGVLTKSASQGDRLRVVSTTSLPFLFVTSLCVTIHT